MTPTMDIARRLPKAELHLHLDGSLSEDFLYARAAERGITMPVSQGNQLWKVLRAGGVPHDHPAADPAARERVLKAMPRANPQGNNWLHFDFCNQFLQTSAELSAATQDLVTRLHADNVQVMEIRFCPSLHCLEGQTAEQVLEAVLAGFHEGCRQCGGLGDGVIGGIIVCALRSNEAEHGVAMAELAAAWLDRGVIGWDLAADEGAHPLHKHLTGFQRAIELGVPTTVHAGEWGSSGTAFPVLPGHHDSLPNVRLALETGALRLGHALTLSHDPALMSMAASRETVMECCLSSNRRRMAEWYTIAKRHCNALLTPTPTRCPGRIIQSPP